MKLIMDIDEDVRVAITRVGLLRISDEMQKKVDKAIQRGTPIPDNATNGDVIKAMFNIEEVDMQNTYCVSFPKEGNHYFFKKWWNSPYKKGGKE